MHCKVKSAFEKVKTVETNQTGLRDIKRHKYLLGAERRDRNWQS